MKTDAKNLERVKIGELTREYEAQGYKVINRPQYSDGPSFLKEINYLPDLIIKSDKENILVEVRSRESIKDAKHLASVSKLVSNYKDWDFLLVYTNPKKKQPLFKREIQNVSAIRETIRAADRFIHSHDAPYQHAALLLLWSSLEACLNLAASDSAGRNAKSSISLIRDGVIAGLISDESRKFLEMVVRDRSAISHGDLSISVDISDLIRLRDICEEILRETNK